MVTFCRRDSIRSLFTVWVFLISPANAATTSENCLLDLNFIPGFLVENDTGAKDELAQWGQARMDAALEKGRKEAASAPDSESCERTLNAYLKVWRKGHLAVLSVSKLATSTPAGGTPAPALTAPPPTLRLLSRRTALLTLPDFADETRAPLEALIAKHRKVLAARSNWIIDVRGNEGGSDSTYYPLLPWLLPDDREDVGAKWLVTPANIEGHEHACALFAPGSKECADYMAKAVTRMRGAEFGSYVSQEDGPDIRYKRVEMLEPRRPTRVAVLVDRHCGSTCEEFLLTVRQSFNVKLIGQSSYGSLDYSNVRPHRLPSEERVLLYATSRSNRLPGLSIDVAGIQPDIYLPDDSNAHGKDSLVLQVHRWLEGGTF
jgi:hypothetical protein